MSTPTRSALGVVLLVVGGVVGFLGGYLHGDRILDALAGATGIALPVVPAEAEITMAEAVVPEPEPDEAPSDAAAPSKGRILYYRNPMGLPDVSPVPKKDSMGMDYIAVYENDVADSGLVSVNPAKVQKLGVVTEEAKLRTLARSVRAVGTVAIDERGLAAVTTRYEGWIERLHVNTTGAVVGRGQVLMEIYSPALVRAEQEYLVALAAREALGNAEDTARATGERLVEAALRKLENLGIGEVELGRLAVERRASRLIAVPSPVSGQVMEKMVIEGMRVMPGELLYTIADLSTVWVLADVFEQDLAMVKEGQAATVTLAAYPDQEFPGRVDFIYPTVSPATRTATVRVELANPDGLLKTDMYGTVEIEAPVAATPVVTVPASAVLDSGTRRIVLVERGEGLFEPRGVGLGQRGDGVIEITEGLEAGERVVVSANFLIDAESNLQAALRAFLGDSASQGADGAGAAEAQP